MNNECGTNYFRRRAKTHAPQQLRYGFRNVAREDSIKSQDTMVVQLEC